MVCQLPFISVPFMHFGIRAAWKELENLPSDEAKLQYIGLVKSACPDFQEAQAGKSKGGGPGGPVFSSLADGPEDSQTGPVSLSVLLTQEVSSTMPIQPTCLNLQLISLNWSVGRHA